MTEQERAQHEIIMKYVRAIPDFQDRGVMHTAPCPCGGTLQCIRSTYNGHIHVKCDRCEFVMME